MKRTHLLAAAGASLAVTTGALAGFVTHTGSVELMTTNWETSIDVPAFDTLGGSRELKSVDILLDGFVLGNAAAENLDAAPSTIDLFLQAEIAISLGGSDLAVVLPVASEMFMAEAFDGIIDFDGPSGTTFMDLMAEESTSTTLMAGIDDLTDWIDTGSVGLMGSATGTSFAAGSGNLVAQFMTSAGLDYSITYEYNSVPAPGALALLAAAGVIARRRRR